MAVSARPAWPWAIWIAVGASAWVALGSLIALGGYLYSQGPTQTPREIFLVAARHLLPGTLAAIALFGTLMRKPWIRLFVPVLIVVYAAALLALLIYYSRSGHVARTWIVYFPVTSALLLGYAVWFVRSDKVKRFFGIAVPDGPGATGDSHPTASVRIPTDSPAPARWRFLNPAILAVAAIVGCLLLYWTQLILVSDKPLIAAEVAKSYGAILKIYFYPTGLVESIYRGSTQKPPQTAWWWWIWVVWFLAWIVSAQPYKPRMRVVGSVSGVIAVLVWSSFVFSVFFVAGLRH